MTAVRCLSRWRALHRALSSTPRRRESRSHGSSMARPAAMMSATGTRMAAAIGIG
jgi:hypothetical protein